VSDSSQYIVEAALDIHVPGVEPLVAPFREKYDPSVEKGMPAHITINYPFLPGIEPNKNLYEELADLFTKIDPFTFSFNGLGRFPGVIYLAPGPEAPFIELIENVAANFPESPPYSGAFDSLVPHLTVAHAEDEELMASIERQLLDLAPEHLPITIQAKQVWLTDNRSGRWQEQKVFKFGRS
jgi:2'-5' RNA ligase